jgi:hypothetical protein
MGKFNCSYRFVLRRTKYNDTSHAWIALHRCVEAFAHTKGETFNSIFNILEKEFNFERKNKNNFPDAKTIEKCAVYLKAERDIFLEKMNFEIQNRKIEKKQGKRKSNNKEFLALCHKKGSYMQPKVGFWGWEKLRN